jgi:putative PIN family toxin of toxin-antitoxin system
MRVVFDTTIVLSALLFSKGQLLWLREVWRQGEVIPLVSAATEQEICRVLNYSKFRLTASEQAVLLNEYLPFCAKVLVPDPPPLVPECRDPKDMPFLWLAVAGQAEYLVTGDGDLLALVNEFQIAIVTAKIFESILSDYGRDVSKD